LAPCPKKFIRLAQAKRQNLFGSICSKFWNFDLKAGYEATSKFRKDLNMSEKESYMQTKEREFKATLKCLEYFPKDKLEYKPHEKSRSAKSLALGFLGEAEIYGKVAKEGKMDGAFHPDKEAKDMDDIIAKFKEAHKKSMEMIKGVSDEDLNKEMDFFGRKMRRIDALWFLMYDLIHHRGQFSVYLRLAGGKVPQIYGPSADEPGDK